MTPLPHMTPLPPPLGASGLVAWRLDQTIHAASWDSGEGAYRLGGRWSSTGLRAVYCAFDPATAILEVAVHKGFRTLDTVPHTLTWMQITDSAGAIVVPPSSVPNPNWLRPGYPSAGQQKFGDALLQRNTFMIVPSVVSTHSWNLVFLASAAAGCYACMEQERFALDTRLHPAP